MCGGAIRGGRGRDFPWASILPELFDGMECSMGKCDFPRLQHPRIPGEPRRSTSTRGPLGTRYPNGMGCGCWNMSDFARRT